MPKKNIIGGGTSAFGDSEGDDNTPNIFEFAPHLDPASTSWKSGAKSQQIQQLQAELDELKAQLQDARTNGVTPENALVPVDNGSRLLGRFTLTRNALVMPDNVTEDELRVVTEFVRDVHGAVQFWAGDLANIYYAVFGASAKVVSWLATELNIEVETLQLWASVCQKIPHLIRIKSLTFSHMREVAYLPQQLEGQEENILNHAAENSLSVRELKGYIKSLIPPKPISQRSVLSLFNKERAPKITELKKVFMLARKGNTQARERLKAELDDYRKWLNEIAQSAGLE